MSSLGPSDSVSQHTVDRAIDNLLERVEPPSMRPRFLPISVLWDYKDCEKDTSQGVILTASNKYRPRMSHAVRRQDGTMVPSQEYERIRHSADIVVRRLINSTNSDPRATMHASTPRTKTFFKKTFQEEYYQAILELEAQQPILRLCSAHWKADALIGQAFLRRNEGGKVAACAASSNPNFSDTDDSQPLEPPQRDVAPVNASKRALDLSPGPKSPSASRTQKRSKDKVQLSPLGLSHNSKFHICPSPQTNACTQSSNAPRDARWSKHSSTSLR